jgi:hypothetical protein
MAYFPYTVTLVSDTQAERKLYYVCIIKPTNIAIWEASVWELLIILLT